jgi:hypothetical protein
MNRNNIYNTTANSGKFQLNMGAIFSVIVGFCLFGIAYLNNNNNLVDIPSVVISIDPDGKCNSYTETRNDQKATYYDCTFTCKYVLNNTSSLNTPSNSPLTVQLSRNKSSNPVKVGDIIILTYDPSRPNKPVLQISRFDTKWFIIGGFLFLFGGVVNLLISTFAPKQVHSAYGAIGIVGSTM